MRAIVLCLTLAASWGCAGNRMLTAEREAANAWNSAKYTFSSAYDAVASGAEPVAYAGEWVVFRSADGLINVARQASSPVGQRVEDASISKRLKVLYGVDTATVDHKINVETRDGVVTLRGRVDDPVVARRAVAWALDTPGVRGVRSELHFPAGPI